MSNDTQASPEPGSADLALSNPSIGSREQLSIRLRRRCPLSVYSLVYSGDTVPLAATPSESVVT